MSHMPHARLVFEPGFTHESQLMIKTLVTTISQMETLPSEHFAITSCSQSNSSRMSVRELQTFLQRQRPR